MSVWIVSVMKDLDRRKNKAVVSVFRHQMLRCEIAAVISETVVHFKRTI